MFVTARFRSEQTVRYDNTLRLRRHPHTEVRRGECASPHADLTTLLISRARKSSKASKIEFCGMSGGPFLHGPIIAGSLPGRTMRIAFRTKLATTGQLSLPSGPRMRLVRWGRQACESGYCADSGLCEDAAVCG